MKKKILVTLICLTIMLMFVACGSNEEGETDDTTVVAETEDKKETNQKETDSSQLGENDLFAEEMKDTSVDATVSNMLEERPKLLDNRLPENLQATSPEREDYIQSFDYIPKEDLEDYIDIGRIQLEEYYEIENVTIRNAYLVGNVYNKEYKYYDTSDPYFYRHYNSTHLYLVYDVVDDDGNTKYYKVRFDHDEIDEENRVPIYHEKFTIGDNNGFAGYGDRYKDLMYDILGREEYTEENYVVDFLYGEIDF